MAMLSVPGYRVAKLLPSSMVTEMFFRKAKKAFGYFGFLRKERTKEKNIYITLYIYIFNYIYLKL